MRQLRTQYVEVIYSDSVTLKPRIGVAHSHCKWHHLIDHIRVLSVLRSNYDAILYRLRDIATYWSKIAKFLYPTCI